MVLERNAVRAILLTRENEVLLLRIRSPMSGEHFWITPGGGLESGETVDEGLKRELQEELGLTEYSVGPLVWRRQHTFTWETKRIRQNERYYIVRAERFEPRMSDLEEAKVVVEFRWWPATELAHSGERLTPLSLARIVARYLSDGVPQEPVDTEVLVD